MSRFVRPDTVRLPISDGDWVLVKRTLTTGEERAMFARYTGTDAEGQVRVRPLESGIAQVCAYLVDWSLTDDDGRPVAIRMLGVAELESVLDNLDPASFREINRAIDRHIADQAAARTEEKKTTLVGDSAS